MKHGVTGIALYGLRMQRRVCIIVGCTDEAGMWR